MSNTTVRRLPPWQLVKRLRRAGLTQWDIAERAKVSQALVTQVINRRRPTMTEKTEAVWREIERVLAPAPAGDGGSVA